MSSQLEEQIKSLINSQIEEQIKPLFTSVTSQSERVVREKTVASISKMVYGSQLGGLSAEVISVREQNKIQFESMEKLNTERFNAVNQRFDDFKENIKDIKDGLKRIENHLMNPPQRQTE